MPDGLVICPYCGEGAVLAATKEICPLAQDAFVLVDREEGGHENVERETGVRVDAMMMMSSLHDAA